MPRKPKKEKSPKWIALEKNIELAILYTTCIAWTILGVILTYYYFKPTIEYPEIMTTVRGQIISFSVAFFNCPLVPVPYWFRLGIFGAGILAIDLNFS